VTPARPCELEAALRANFPNDAIEPVGKGEFGWRCHAARDHAVSQACGALLRETKGTKNRTDGWLAQLRKNLADALSHGSAALFVLVSEKAADGILERLRGVAGTGFRRPFNKSAVEAVRTALAARV
jgi:hypothetical protein